MSNQLISQLEQLLESLNNNSTHNEMSNLRAENKELKAKMKKMEQKLAMKNVQQLEAQIKELEENNQEAWEEFEELEKELIRSEVKRMTLDCKLEESKKEIGILQAGLVSSDVKMRKLADQCDQQNEKLGARIRELEQQNEEFKEKNEQLEEKLSKMSLEAESQTVEKPANQEGRWKREMAALQERRAYNKFAEVQDLEEKLAVMEEKKEKAWKMWINRSTEFRRMQEENEKLERELTEMNRNWMEMEQDAFIAGLERGRKTRWD